jgi:hypothetical protein
MDSWFFAKQKRKAQKWQGLRSDCQEFRGAFGRQGRRL